MSSLLKKHPTIMIKDRKKDKQKIGNYSILQILDEQPFIKLKHGKHIPTSQDVLIKIIDKTYIYEDEKNFSHLTTEISILKILHHKNLIRLYELRETASNLFIIMEYCENKSFFNFVKKKIKLNEIEACKYFQDLIDGLEYLHSQNISNRDLTPHNLFLDHKFSLKISNFSYSKIYENEKLLTTPIGTLQFAAPEVLNGKGYHGLFSDIWSAGGILYFSLTGEFPFFHESDEITLMNIKDGKYNIPNYISPLARDLLEKILNKKCMNRYDIKQIKLHPWFNLIKPKMNKGINISLNCIPVDEVILKKMEINENKNNKNNFKENLKEKIMENVHDDYTAEYYLILKELIGKGNESIGDMESQEFVDFINDPVNLLVNKEILEKEKKIEEENKLKVFKERQNVVEDKENKNGIVKNLFFNKRNSFVGSNTTNKVNSFLESGKNLKGRNFFLILFIDEEIKKKDFNMKQFGEENGMILDRIEKKNKDFYNSLLNNIKTNKRISLLTQNTRKEKNFNLVTAKNLGYIDNSNKIMLYNITNIQNDYDQIDEEEIKIINSKIKEISKLPENIRRKSSFRANKIIKEEIKLENFIENSNSRKNSFLKFLENNENKNKGKIFYNKNERLCIFKELIKRTIENDIKKTKEINYIDENAEKSDNKCQEAKFLLSNFRKKGKTLNGDFSLNNSKINENEIKEKNGKFFLKIIF